IRDSERTLASREKAFETVAKRHKKAGRELEEASLQLATFSDELRAARIAEKGLVKLTSLHAKRDKAVITTAKALKAAEDELTTAKERFEAARAAKADAETADFAAKLGAQVNAGDPCPV